MGALMYVALACFIHCLEALIGVCCTSGCGSCVEVAVKGSPSWSLLGLAVSYDGALQKIHTCACDGSLAD